MHSFDQKVFSTLGALGKNLGFKEAMSFAPPLYNYGDFFNFKNKNKNKNKNNMYIKLEYDVAPIVPHRIEDLF